jgi:O-antigen/teichoic acid export membrane protein
LGSVVLPLLANQIGDNKSIQSKRTLVLAIKVNFFIVMPLVLGIGVASPYIMGLYGEGFSSGWLTLVVIVITAGIVAVQTPVGQIIAASGRMWLGFFMNAGWALVFIVTTFLWIDLGSLGLTVSRAFAYLVHAIWTFGFAFYLLQRK